VSDTPGNAGDRPDSILRAMTDDGAFRVVTARTTATVRGAVAAQAARGPNAVRFGDLLTGAVLYRETMAPRLRVQGILRGAAGGRIVADAHPDGATRGLVTRPDGGSDEVAVGYGAQLEMMRSLPSGAIHKGVVEVPAGGEISRALMEYLQTSEQVVSMVAVATVVEGDAVVSAGGYLLQLLPEVGEGPLMVMTERLRDFERIEALVRAPEFSPDALARELLYGMPFTRLEERSVRFECQCSLVRVVSTFATLPRADLEELLSDNEVLEVGCDYCGREYRVPPTQLRGLLEES
jgi:molecular chaperone Hsp33